MLRPLLHLCNLQYEIGNHLTQYLTWKLTHLFTDNISPKISSTERFSFN